MRERENRKRGSDEKEEIYKKREKAQNEIEEGIEGKGYKEK